MKFNNEGTPLPAKPDNTVEYGRDNGRKMVPTQADFAGDVIGKKHTAADERVRQIERARHADFWRRRYGRQITEAEYPAELQNEGGAA
jgi:hypothetical protein